MLRLPGKHVVVQATNLTQVLLLCSALSLQCPHTKEKTLSCLVKLPATSSSRSRRLVKARNCPSLSPTWLRCRPHLQLKTKLEPSKTSWTLRFSTKLCRLVHATWSQPRCVTTTPQLSQAKSKTTTLSNKPSLSWPKLTSSTSNSPSTALSASRLTSVTEESANLWNWLAKSSPLKSFWRMEHLCMMLASLLQVHLEPCNKHWNNVWLRFALTLSPCLRHPTCQTIWCPAPLETTMVTFTRPSSTVPRTRASTSTMRFPITSIASWSPSSEPNFEFKPKSPVSKKQLFYWSISNSHRLLFSWLIDWFDLLSVFNLKSEI